MDTSLAGLSVTPVKTTQRVTSVEVFVIFCPAGFSAQYSTLVTGAGRELRGDSRQSTGASKWSAQSCG